jgi:galactose oxidase-like protein/Kelch motif protein
VWIIDSCGIALPPTLSQKLLRMEVRSMRHLAMVGLVLLLVGGGLFASSASFAVSGSWSTQLLAARMDATMAYDTYGDIFVFFGGSDGYQKFNEAWRMWPGYNNNAWQKMLFSQSVELPVARNGHTLIWDPVQRRLILFGGKDAGNNYLNDVWSLPLWTWDGQTWQQYYGNWQHLTTSGTSVPGLTQHTAVLDSQRGRMLVYGGEESNGTLSDQLYALDLQTLTWSVVTIGFPGTGPHGRQEHVSIYDAAHDALFVYGGEEYQNGNFNWASPTVWRLRLGFQPPEWDVFVSQVGSAGLNGGAVYDPNRHEMVLYGGGLPGEAGGSVYRVQLDTPGSYQVVQLTMSLRRESFACAYDASHSKMQIFGGSEGVLMANGKPVPRNDTWNLTLGTSPAWSPTYERPYGGTWFSDATLVYDDQHNRTILFGGATGMNGAVNGTFALGLSGSSEQWTVPNISGTLPSPRFDHTAVYDRWGDRMVVYGGVTGSAGLSDLWALNRTGGQDWSSNNYQWVQLPNVGGPGALAGHSAVFADISPTNRKMIIFGGRVPSNGTLKSQTWSYDLIAQTWQLLTTTGQAPSARADHGAVYDYPNKRMFIFGGVTSSGYTNDVYWLNLDTNTWSKAQFTGPRPSARSNMTVVMSPYSDASMIVFGGEGDTGLLSDAWLVRVWAIPYGSSWSQITPSGVLPGERTGQAAIYNGYGNMLVAGGRWYTASYQLDELFNDTWNLNYDMGYYASLKMKPTGDANPGIAGSRDRMSVEILSSSGSGATMQLKAAGDPGPFDLAVYDVAGRLLRRLEVSPLLKESTAAWDFRDAQGSRVPSGIYFVKLRGKNSSASQRIVALH